MSVKPCSKKLRPGIRSLDRSAKCAPQPGDSRSSRRVWTLRAIKKNHSFIKKTPKKLGQVGGWVSAGGASPWEFSALTASRLDDPRMQKNPKGKRFSWPHTRAAHTGHTHRDERPGGPRGAGSPAPSPPPPRTSEFTAPGRRAACPMSSIRNLSWPSQRRFQKSAKSVQSLN